MRCLYLNIIGGWVNDETNRLNLVSLKYPSWRSSQVKLRKNVGIIPFKCDNIKWDLLSSPILENRMDQPKRSRFASVIVSEPRRDIVFTFTMYRSEGSEGWLHVWTTPLLHVEEIWCIWFAFMIWDVDILYQNLQDTVVSHIVERATGLYPRF